MNINTVDGDEYTDDTWTNQSVVVSAAATDAQSEMLSFQYTLDGGATWTNYTVPFTLTAHEIHSVIFQASDALGNKAVESRKVKISNGNLELTPVMKLIPLEDGGDYTSGEWTNRSVDISISEVTGDHDIDSDAKRQYIDWYQQRIRTACAWRRLYSNRQHGSHP